MLREQHADCNDMAVTYCATGEERYMVLSHMWC
jgi:hypothetical protein